MKKDIKNVKKLRLNRESLHELDLRTATGGATAAANTCHVDCSFIYTGCHGTCNCTTTA